MQLAPFNITIIDPEEYIPRKGALPVSSHAMFETNTSRFHPEGFFSEAIFGQLGSRDRLVKKGYINLRTEIINPHLFKQLISLKSFYQDILAGTCYAYFDEEEKDFRKTTPTDEKGSTGYSFFLEHLPHVVFKQTESTKRRDKIALLAKYADRTLITKYIVIPAGLRDVRETNGRMAPEEINKLYYALLSLTQALPDNYSRDPLYDAIRYKIQMQVQEIYNYIANLVDGKGGFAQRKYAARAVVYGNRNVITAAPLTRVTSPQAPNMFQVDEVQVPLFQGLKGAVPLIVHELKSVFFDQIFLNQTNNIPLIDPKTLRLNYVDVDTSVIQRFTSSDGINDLINGFRNVNIQKDPVTVPGRAENAKEATPYYLYLKYDNDDEIFTFRNLDDFITARRDFSKLTTDNVNLKAVADLPKDSFTVMGTAASKIYGMDVEPNDVDIVASASLWKKIQADSSFVKQKNGVYRRENENGNVDVYNNLHQIKKSIQVGEYKVIDPGELLEIYSSLGRAKDKFKIEFLKHEWELDMSRVSPLTWVELFYMAGYSALHNKHGTVTRHPMLLIENIQIFKIHLMSTQPSRIVKLRAFTADKDAAPVVLPEYPILTSEVKTSLSVFPSALPRYGGETITLIK